MSGLELMMERQDCEKRKDELSISLGFYTIFLVKRLVEVGRQEFGERKNIQDSKKHINKISLDQECGSMRLISSPAWYSWHC